MIVNKIKCGHTSVRFSQQFTALSDKHRYPQFPLAIKTWGDNMVVLGRYNIEDSVLKPGTVLTSINGRKNKEIIETMFQYVSTDGNSNNHKSQVLSNNFTAWYKTIFGIDSVLQIGYIDSTLQEQFINIKAYTPKIDTTKKKTDSTKTIVKSVPKKPSKKQVTAAKILGYRSMNIDTSLNTAFIRLTTFSKGNLRRFFRQSFKTIHEKQIKNLVIDLRENGGGSVETSTLLTRYLKDTSYKIGDTVVAINRKFQHKKNIQNWLQYWLLMHFDGRKMKDGLIHNRSCETRYFKPKKRHHFNGNIFIVQGGYTFSAATMFASSLKGQKNVTIVGEESGGGFYGNTAMRLPTIVLPNTKLKVGLPMYRLVMNKNRPKGRGIIPDIEVPPSSNAIKKGIDIKMQTVRDLIKKGQ